MAASKLPKRSKVSFSDLYKLLTECTDSVFDESRGFCVGVGNPRWYYCSLRNFSSDFNFQLMLLPLDGSPVGVGLW